MKDFLTSPQMKTPQQGVLFQFKASFTLIAWGNHTGLDWCHGGQWKGFTAHPERCGSLLKQSMKKQYALVHVQTQAHPLRNKYSRLQAKSGEPYPGLPLPWHVWVGNKLNGELLTGQPLTWQVFMRYTNKEHWAMLQRWCYVLFASCLVKFSMRKGYGLGCWISFFWKAVK